MKNTRMKKVARVIAIGLILACVCSITAFADMYSFGLGTSQYSAKSPTCTGPSGAANGYVLSASQYNVKLTLYGADTLTSTAGYWMAERTLIKGGGTAVTGTFKGKPFWFATLYPISSPTGRDAAANGAITAS